jgi:hypothetical protein
MLIKENSCVKFQVFSSTAHSIYVTVYWADMNVTLYV